MFSTVSSYSLPIITETHNHKLSLTTLALQFPSYTPLQIPGEMLNSTLSPSLLSVLQHSFT